MITSFDEFRKLSHECEEILKKVKQTIYICTGTQCVASGSMDIYSKFKELIDQKGIAVELKTKSETDLEAVKTGCQGMCGKGPLVTIEPLGIFYTNVKVKDCEEILEKTIMNGELLPRLLFKNNGVVYEKKNDIPFYYKQRKEVLDKCGQMDPDSIYNFIGLGGYKGLVKALETMQPEEICTEVKTSNIRGRGGAGFSTGTKWLDVLREKEKPKYIICNGDEGNPGAFIDGAIMEGSPHSVIEGMAIAGFATGATRGYIYVRAEYPLSVKRLTHALDICRKVGLLGKNILGTGFDFDITINQGAGAFVCGEGGALIASIEGKRGIPRVKPPRTTSKGLFQKPTVLNNVETFASISSIILNGSEWYLNIGPKNSPGTKTFSVVGNTKLGGMVEVEMGTTVRELVYGVCDGVQRTRELKAVQMGGPSGVCMPVSQLDVKLDFDALDEVDGMMGAGGVVVFDDTICMVDIARSFMKFTQSESCGKCTPCREGSFKMLKLLDKIAEGRGTMEDIETIEQLANTITKYSLCGLGKTAANPVISTLTHFREEYLEHIVDKVCKTGCCSMEAISNVSSNDNEFDKE